MIRWTKINYREFWDVPRIFFVEDAGRLFLFDCQFDNITEDYPTSYQVFLMPTLSAAEFAGSWAKLWLRAIRKLATVPISTVKFDATKRAFIDAAIFDTILGVAPLTNETVAHAHAEPHAPA